MPIKTADTTGCLVDLCYTYYDFDLLYIWQVAKAGSHYVAHVAVPGSGRATLDVVLLRCWCSDMSRKITPHPFRWEKPSAWWNVTNRSTVAALVAAVAATLPSQQLGIVSSRFSDVTSALFCDRLVFATLGALVGCVSHQVLDFLRLRILKRLFQYQGWVTHPRATKTKVSMK